MRLVVEQSRRNGDDLAIIKGRLDRIESRLDGVEWRLDSIGRKIDGLHESLKDLVRTLPAVISEALRERRRERDG